MELQYKIKEKGFDEIRKKVILRTIPIALLAVLSGLAISYFNTNDQSSDVSVLLIMIPIALGAMAFGLLKGIKRQKDIFNSYTLIIDEEKVIRRQNLTPDIDIPLSEIKEIIKSKDGAFAIKGKNIRNVIGIPSQIEKIDELELRLSEIVEITTSDKKTLIQKFPWALPLIMILLMMTVYMSENKIFVGLAGVSLTIGLIYSLTVTQQSKHIDRKTKKGMWLILIVVLSVIAITYFKLFGSN